MANASSQLLSKSMANNDGAVLLNPCFSSSTNVWYTESGVLIADENTNRIAANARDWVIFVVSNRQRGGRGRREGLGLVNNASSGIGHAHLVLAAITKPTDEPASHVPCPGVEPIV